MSGEPFQVRDVGRVAQRHVPAQLLDQLLAQVRRPAAGLDPDPLHDAQRADQPTQRLAVVRRRAVQQHRALLVEHAHLDGILVIVQADENRYIAHGPLLPDETLVN